MAAMMQVARALRRIGAQNSGGEDTHLVYVNDNEFAQLKAGGGSGKPDPQTGIPHFKQDQDKENSGGRAADSDSNDGGGLGGGDSKTGGDDGGDLPGGDRTPATNTSPGAEDLPGTAQDLRNIAARPTRTPAQLDRGRAAAAAGDPNSVNLLGSPRLTPEQAANLSTPGVQQTAFGIDAERRFNVGKFLAGMFKGTLSGGPGLGLATGMMSAFETVSPEVNGGGWATESVTPSESVTPADRAAKDGGRDLDRQQMASVVASTSAPSTDGTTSPTTPTTSDIDLFSALSRNRYGRKNQMLGGLLNYSNIQTAKPTLGA